MLAPPYTKKEVTQRGQELVMGEGFHERENRTLCNKGLFDMTSHPPNPCYKHESHSSTYG